MARLTYEAIMTAINAFPWSNLNKEILGETMRQFLTNLLDSGAETLLADGKSIEEAIKELRKRPGGGESDSSIIYIDLPAMGLTINQFLDDTSNWTSYLLNGKAAFNIKVTPNVSGLLFITTASYYNQWMFFSAQIEDDGMSISADAFPYDSSLIKRKGRFTGRIITWEPWKYEIKGNDNLYDKIANISGGLVKIDLPAIGLTINQFLDDTDYWASYLLNGKAAFNIKVTPNVSGLLFITTASYYNQWMFFSAQIEDDGMSISADAFPFDSSLIKRKGSYRGGIMTWEPWKYEIKGNDNLYDKIANISGGLVKIEITDKTTLNDFLNDSSNWAQYITSKDAVIVLSNSGASGILSITRGAATSQWLLWPSVISSDGNSIENMFTFQNSLMYRYADGTTWRPWQYVINGNDNLYDKIANLIHNNLPGRESADAHPISAITGLQEALEAAGDVYGINNVALSGDVRDLNDWLDNTEGWRQLTARGKPLFNITHTTGNNEIYTGLMEVGQSATGRASSAIITVTQTINFPVVSENGIIVDFKTESVILKRSGVVGIIIETVSWGKWEEVGAGGSADLAGYTKNDREEQITSPWSFISSSEDAPLSLAVEGNDRLSLPFWRTNAEGSSSKLAEIQLDADNNFSLTKYEENAPFEIVKNRISLKNFGLQVAGSMSVYATNADIDLPPRATLDVVGTAEVRATLTVGYEMHIRGGGGSSAGAPGLPARLSFSTSIGFLDMELYNAERLFVISWNNSDPPNPQNIAVITPSGVALGAIKGSILPEAALDVYGNSKLRGAVEIEDGITVMAGTSGLRVSPNGIEKWNNDAESWEPFTGGSGGTSNYTELSNKPVLKTDNNTGQTPAASETINGTVNLHRVSKTGSYGDLLNKPAIPPAQVNSDWDAYSGAAQILNKPAIPDTAVITVKELSASRTITGDDKGALLSFISSADCILTVPVDSSVPFAVGTKIFADRSGTGAVTIAAASGVTINYSSDLTNSIYEKGLVCLIKKSANTWSLFGDMEEV